MKSGTKKTTGIAMLGIAVSMLCFGAAEICWVTSPGDCTTTGKQANCSFTITNSNGTHSTFNGFVSSAGQVDQCINGSPGNVDCSPDTNSIITCTYTCTVEIGGVNVNHPQSKTQPANKTKGDGC